MILIVDDDLVMGKCIKRALEKNSFETKLCSNAFEAIEVVSEEIPEMVFLEIMLTGPDGFTLINEMASYADTMKVPIVIVSEKDFSGIDLKDYAVVGALNKNTMRPEEVVEYARKYTK